MSKYLKTREGSLEDLAKQMQNKVLESDYQDKFKKELDKAGRPIGQMTGAEKKAFFNKLDKMHTAKNEQVKNPYAVGMAQAMKAKDDQPPLKKSTITKAHDIAKSIEKDQKEEVEVKETHSFITNKQNQKQKEVGGEKEPIKTTKNEWKTFAMMAAELREKKEQKKEDKKEMQAGDDTRDKKQKTMTGEIATSPEMNPKVDYKY
jgi:hypothetical protein